MQAIAFVNPVFNLPAFVEHPQAAEAAGDIGKVFVLGARMSEDEPMVLFQVLGDTVL
jgi:hypothetical protein